MTEQQREICDFVLHAIVKPARRRGETRVKVAVKDVNEDMGFPRPPNHRYPNIITTLDRDFEAYAGVECVKRTGKGQTSTVTWTFHI